MFNARQQRFAEEYIIDLFPGPAAIRAGYSPRTADKIAHRLLNKVEVRDRITELKQVRSKKTMMTAEDVLRESSLLAGSSILDYVDDSGCLLGNIVDIPRDAAKAISSIDQEKLPNGNVKTKIRLWDKNKALQLTGRHVDVQAFLDRVEVTDGLSDRLARMRDVTPTVSPVVDAVAVPATTSEG
jgi:phage terminase small subunit